MRQTAVLLPVKHRKRLFGSLVSAITFRITEFKKNSDLSPHLPTSPDLFQSVGTLNIPWDFQTKQLTELVPHADMQFTSTCSPHCLILSLTLKTSELEDDYPETETQFPSSESQGNHKNHQTVNFEVISSCHVVQEKEEERRGLLRLVNLGTFPELCLD